MNPVNLKGVTTTVLGAPVDWNEAVSGPCVGLPVQVLETGFRSFWKPSADELSALLSGQPIILEVTARSHPVVGVGVLAPEPGKDVAGHA